MCVVYKHEMLDAQKNMEKTQEMEETIRECKA